MLFKFIFIFILKISDVTSGQWKWRQPTQTCGDQAIGWRWTHEEAKTSGESCLTWPRLYRQPSWLSSSSTRSRNSVSIRVSCSSELCWVRALWTRWYLENTHTQTQGNVFMISYTLTVIHIRIYNPTSFSRTTLHRPQAVTRHARAVYLIIYHVSHKHILHFGAWRYFVRAEFTLEMVKEQFERVFFAQ